MHIVPTLGRIVHVTVQGGLMSDPRVLAAIVTRVHTETCVNLTVFGETGGTGGMEDVNYDEAGAVNTWRWPPRI